MEKVKLGFFHRLKKAVFNLEEYGMFALEKLAETAKYFIKLTLVFSLILSFFLTISIYNNPYESLKYISEMAENFQITNDSIIYEDLKIELNSVSLYIYFFIIFFISIFITYFIINLLDVLLITVFGIIASFLSSVRLKFLPIFNLSVYAMTLSIMLKLIYLIINQFTGFSIKYFDIMYIIVAYIYLITAILMIKSDLIKQKIEIMKIIEEQKKVHEEKNSDNKQEEKDETNKNEEPESKKENENPEGSKA